MAFHSVINSLFVSPVHAGAGGQCIDPQTKFAASIERERARADRNGHGFSLIAYEVKKADRNKPSIRHLLNILPGRIRLTDEMGWIDKQQVGILLYSTTKEDAGNFARQIDASIISATGSAPRYVIHGYPSSTVGTGNLARKGPSQQAAPVKDSEARGKSKKTGHDIILTANHRMPKWKRMTDIAGASLGLMICAPVFMLIAGFIKTVSPGPVFFKQQRIGFGGKTFTFFKFRTMKVNADTTAHQKLLAELIKDDNSPGSAGKPMTKLDHDPQIIPCGNFLRKSCIDELPQLINVLIGDMSLIGPRPPIPYEVDEYDRWHRARLSTIPGMTGLWQISGKNRLTFKEMVRLDIRYLRNRSLWHDIKILLLTPRAIVSQIKEIL